MLPNRPLKVLRKGSAKVAVAGYYSKIIDLSLSKVGYHLYGKGASRPDSLALFRNAKIRSGILIRKRAAVMDCVEGSV